MPDLPGNVAYDISKGGYYDLDSGRSLSDLGFADGGKQAMSQVRSSGRSDPLPSETMGTDQYLQHFGFSAPGQLTPQAQSQQMGQPPMPQTPFGPPPGSPPGSPPPGGGQMQQPNAGMQDAFRQISSMFGPGGFNPQALMSQLGGLGYGPPPQMGGYGMAGRMGQPMGMPFGGQGYTGPGYRPMGYGGMGFGPPPMYGNPYQMGMPGGMGGQPPRFGFGGMGMERGPMQRRFR